MIMIWEDLIMNMEKNLLIKFKKPPSFLIGLFVTSAFFLGSIPVARAITVVCPLPGPCPANLPSVVVSAEVVGLTNVVTGGGGSGSIFYLTEEEVAKIEELKKKIFKAADYNSDGRVDIIDLSIMLYYYGQRGPTIVRYDLNADGVIGLEDISIMLYYWTIV